MRTLTLIAATALFCTTAIAQEKAAPAKEAVQVTKTTDELTETRRALSGELKNSVGMAENLMTQMKKLSAEDPSKAESYAKALEDIKATHISLMEQLTAVNQVKGTDSKTVFEQASMVNKEAMGSLTSIKKEFVPEGK